MGFVFDEFSCGGRFGGTLCTRLGFGGSVQKSWGGECVIGHGICVLERREEGGLR